MIKSKLMFGMTAAVIFAFAGAASASDYRSAHSKPWSNPGAWEVLSGGVWVAATTAPGSGDNVDIRSGSPISISSANAAAASVTVDASATLTINAGFSLTMDNTGSVTVDGTMTVRGNFYAGSGGGVDVENGGLVDINGGAFYADGAVTIHSGGIAQLTGTAPFYSATSATYVNGGGLLEMGGTNPLITLNNANAIQLVSSGSELLVVVTSAVINGSGSLQGQDNAAAIYMCPDGNVATSGTLTNEAIIHGRLTIAKNPNNSNGSANAGFANGYDSVAALVGVVQSDTNTTGSILKLDASLNSIADSSSGSCSAPQWKVTNSHAALTFDKSATSLNGDFFVGPGVLNINQSVTTAGGLKFASGGSVVVASGATFTFSNGYCSGSTCSSTASPFVGATTVTCP